MTEKSSWLEKVYKTQFSDKRPPVADATEGCQPEVSDSQDANQWDCRKHQRLLLRFDAADVKLCSGNTLAADFGRLQCLLSYALRNEGLQQTPAGSHGSSSAVRPKRPRTGDGQSSPNDGSQGLKGGPTVCWRNSRQPSKQHERADTPYERQRIGTRRTQVERLERQMRSFMNRVGVFDVPEKDGKKTLKCWTCGREGHLQRSCRHKALKLIAPPKGGVGKLINGHLVGRRLPDFGKPHFQVCQISTKSTGENGIFIMGHVNELPLQHDHRYRSQCVYHSERSGSKIKRETLWTPAPRGATDRDGKRLIFTEN
ncbi:hypothetical protein TNCV_4277221 [Trichonephila clavipes]|nr:hypothetical protein TNCV_4277221 [Trichonephila clavipes]